MINDNLQYLLKTPIDRKFKGVKGKRNFVEFFLFVCLFLFLFFYIIPHYSLLITLE